MRPPVQIDERKIEIEIKEKCKQLLVDYYRHSIFAALFPSPPDSPAKATPFIQSRCSMIASSAPRPSMIAELRLHVLISVLRSHAPTCSALIWLYRCRVVTSPLIRSFLSRNIRNVLHVARAKEKAERGPQETSLRHRQSVRIQTPSVSDDFRVRSVRSFLLAIEVT